MKGDFMFFSDFFSKRRISLGFTLRKFCQNKGYDAGYISRLENGLIAPPDDIEKLKALALALEIEEGSTDWVSFFDLAAASKGQIPGDLKNDERIMTALPAFYRTMRSRKIDEKGIDNLIKLLNGEGE